MRGSSVSFYPGGRGSPLSGIPLAISAMINRFARTRQRPQLRLRIRSSVARQARKSHVLGDQVVRNQQKLPRLSAVRGRVQREIGDQLVALSLILAGVEMQLVTVFESARL